MTFNPANPPNAESPALFPAENRTNMSRLQTLFGADHQFNATAATNDGWHTIVHWVEQSTLIDPLSPATNAPSNTGGPCITWEQQDVYNVPRPWFRLPNGGNVTSMMGFSEIRVLNKTITGLNVTIVTPPDNTFGEIYVYIPATNQFAAKGSYVKSAGVCRAFAFPFIVPPATVQVGQIAFVFTGGDISASVNSGGSFGPANYYITYRYL
jgi:hypothetical protein